MRRSLLCALLLLVGVLGRADEARVGEARQIFQNGLELVKRAQWFEALSAFERSMALRSHPVTAYNIAVCERTLGRYTRARAMFERALQQSGTEAGALPASLVAESRGFLVELDHVLARVQVIIDPADAAIAVDGRPLAEAETHGAATAVAGIVDP